MDTPRPITDKVVIPIAVPLMAQSASLAPLLISHAEHGAHGESSGGLAHVLSHIGMTPSLSSTQPRSV